ncbi:hypothetical protein EDC01DRAFT_776867 [Geopyxis carbonaria]|nr:hypothetical protein EDC01DRAFT_776867 [Geopyxis carbonaria]
MNLKKVAKCLEHMRRESPDPPPANPLSTVSPNVPIMPAPKPYPPVTVPVTRASGVRPGNMAPPATVRNAATPGPRTSGPGSVRPFKSPVIVGNANLPARRVEDNFRITRRGCAARSNPVVNQPEPVGPANETLPVIQFPGTDGDQPPPKYVSFGRVPSVQQEGNEIDKAVSAPTDPTAVETVPAPAPVISEPQVVVSPVGSSSPAVVTSREENIAITEHVNEGDEQWGATPEFFHENFSEGARNYSPSPDVSHLPVIEFSQHGNDSVPSPSDAVEPIEATHSDDQDHDGDEPDQDLSTPGSPFDARRPSSEADEQDSCIDAVREDGDDCDEKFIWDEEAFQVAEAMDLAAPAPVVIETQAASAHEAANASSVPSPAAPVEPAPLRATTEDAQVESQVSETTGGKMVESGTGPDGEAPEATDEQSCDDMSNSRVSSAFPSPVARSPATPPSDHPSPAPIRSTTPCPRLTSHVSPAPQLRSPDRNGRSSKSSGNAEDAGQHADTAAAASNDDGTDQEFGDLGDWDVEVAARAEALAQAQDAPAARSEPSAAPSAVAEHAEPPPAPASQAAPALQAEEEEEEVQRPIPVPASPSSAETHDVGYAECSTEELHARAADLRKGFKAMKAAMNAKLMEINRELAKRNREGHDGNADGRAVKKLCSPGPSNRRDFSSGTRPERARDPKSGTAKHSAHSAASTGAACQPLQQKRQRSTQDDGDADSGRQVKKMKQAHVAEPAIAEAQEDGGQSRKRGRSLYLAEEQDFDFDAPVAKKARVTAPEQRRTPEPEPEPEIAPVDLTRISPPAYRVHLTNACRRAGLPPPPAAGTTRSAAEKLADDRLVRLELMRALRGVHKAATPATPPAYTEVPEELRHLTQEQYTAHLQRLRAARLRDCEAEYRERANREPAVPSPEAEAARLRAQDEEDRRVHLELAQLKEGSGRRRGRGKQKGLEVVGDEIEDADVWDE